MAEPDRRAGRNFSDAELQDLVSSADTDGRAPDSRAVALLIAAIARFWSVFQIWIADPQFWLAQYIPGLRIIGPDQTRPMHLALALVLSFLVFPAFRSSARRHVPIVDWVLALAAFGVTFYIFWGARSRPSSQRNGCRPRAPSPSR